MKKLIYLSMNTILLLISWFLAGCEEPINNNFQPKTFEEYYNNLENTTMEIELIIKDKRATCFYSNNSDIFVYTIKYQHAAEFGYIYDKSNNILYTLEDQTIQIANNSELAEEYTINLFKTSHILFYLNFDTTKFEYVDEVTICNKICDKYRTEAQVKSQNVIFNFYIDQETGFCLKAVCTNGENTDIYFETKSFKNSPNVENYLQLLEEYNKTK